MNLFRSLLGSATASTKVPAPSGERSLSRAAATDAQRVIKVRLAAAEVVLQGGSEREIRADGPIQLETTPDGVLVTELALAPQVQGAASICRLGIPNGASVDLQLASGALTVLNFQGTLRARVASGGVSVEKSEGRFHVVAPDGRVAFDSVRGEIDIHTNHGMVTASQIQGGVQAVSGGGAMEFEDIDGPIAARTLTGSIQASDIRGTARLSTRTGAVRISGVCGQLKVRTQSGDITLDCSIVAHTTLETFKGNLDVRLGPDTDAHIEAKVGQGVVRAERVSPLPGSNRRTLLSTLGLGQSRLRIASEMGVINVAGPPRLARVARPQAAVQ